MRLGGISFSMRSSIRLCLQCCTYEIVYSDFLSDWLYLSTSAGCFFWLILRNVSLPKKMWKCMLCSSVQYRSYGEHSRWEHGSSLSKSISWIFKVHIMLPIVWCTLSTIVFAYGFFTLMGLNKILFTFIVLKSAKSSLPVFTIILLGRRYCHR